MIGVLNPEQIAELLSRQRYAHLGFNENGKVHVLPVTYAYKDNAIYSFSFPGNKIDILRENPDVCFQVEQCISADEWQSAIAWGKYEELAGEEREEALSIMLDLLFTDATAFGESVYMPFRNNRALMEKAVQDEGCILYRITIEEATGRHERYDT